MKTTSIKKELHHFIDIIDDRKAEAIYVLFENEINIKDTDNQTNLIILNKILDKVLNCK